jgi:hypothetical protein
MVVALGANAGPDQPIHCAVAGSAMPGETVAAGWERSYSAGCVDASGHLAAGSEVLHLAGHKGKLYAAIGYWMDPRNPWYGGADLGAGWAQVLRLDAPDAAWQVDAQFPRHLRTEILYSATFNTDSEGQALSEPVNLLLAATYEGNGQYGMSLFTRDDNTGTWEKSKIIAGDTGVRGEGNSVRAMHVYRDRITRVDRLFVSVGVRGIMSGAYDPTVHGRIRWARQSESGAVPVRPLAIVEANGALYFSSAGSIYRRLDGLAPSWQRVYDVHDDRSPGAESLSGGIRGLTAVPNPNGQGSSLLFAWVPGKHSRGCIMRLDPDSGGGFKQVDEDCVDRLVARSLGVTSVHFAIAGYNNLLAVPDPSTGKTVHLLGLEAWIDRGRLPVVQGDGQGGFYAGALYAIREAPGRYRIAEVNGSINANAPPLVATRAYAVSPFRADRGDLVYFAGFDCNVKRSSDTAWIFRAPLSVALQERTRWR